MDDFYRRVYDARIPFLRKDISPDHLYIGRAEYMQMRRDLQPYEFHPEDHIKSFMGLRIFVVDEDSHFAVCHIEDQK
jgi:hypothetical protein